MTKARSDADKKTARKSAGGSVQAGKKTRKSAKPKAKLFVPDNAEALAAVAAEPSTWKSKVGRPVIFDADKAIALMEVEIRRYLEGESRAYELVQISETTTKIIGKAYPTIERIALFCGVDTNTFIANCNAKDESGRLKNEQLFRSYSKFKELGKTMLVEGGLVGVYDSRLVSFLGNVNYGLIPQQKVEQAVEMKSMVKVYAELDRIYEDELARQEAQQAEMVQRKAQLEAEFAGEEE